MKIRYDHMADAMYIRLKEGKPAKTTEVFHDMFIDINADGELLGIEILFVTKQGFDLSSIAFEQYLPENYQQTLIDARNKRNP
jgi:uncharacterized protein YuzE